MDSYTYLKNGKVYTQVRWSEAERAEFLKKMGNSQEQIECTLEMSRLQWIERYLAECKAQNIHANLDIASWAYARYRAEADGRYRLDTID